MKFIAIGLLTGSILFVLTGAANALGPFTENFNSGTANWRQNVSANNVILNASGGPDGSTHVSSDFAFPSAFNPQVALFRAHDTFDASGDAFVGNWLAANINHVSAYVKHNVHLPNNDPFSLDFFLRLAKSANSPAVSFTLPQQIAPDVWTRIDFDISFSNPLHTNEGPPTEAFYNDVLANVGNLQIGVIVPAAMATNPTVFRHDLDNVNIVPEPASGLLAIVGLILAAGGRRRKR